MAIDPSERGPHRRSHAGQNGPRSLLFLTLRVFLSALVVGAIVGLVLGVQARAWMLDLADGWDHQYDTLILQDGRLSATGPRLPHFVEGGELVFDLHDLREPEDLPLEGNVVIFQTRQLMARDKGVIKIVDYKTAQMQFGIPDIEINSESLRRAIDTWGSSILLGVLLSSSAIWTIGKVQVCLFASLVAAVLLKLGIKENRRRFGGWLRESWRASWVLPPLLGLLEALGAQIGAAVAVLALAAPLAGGAWLTRNGRLD